MRVHDALKLCAIRNCQLGIALNLKCCGTRCQIRIGIDSNGKGGVITGRMSVSISLRLNDRIITCIDIAIQNDADVVSVLLCSCILSTCCNQRIAAGTCIGDLRHIRYFKFQLVVCRISFICECKGRFVTGIRINILECTISTLAGRTCDRERTFS